MKRRILVLLLSVLSMQSLWATSVIYYEAPSKLNETTSDREYGLHTNAFGGVSIHMHNFSEGYGEILFSGDITTVGHIAFWGCKEMTSVRVVANVTSIGPSAFLDCNNLVSVILPTSITQIGDAAFSQCYKLQSFTFNNGITSIGDFAFRYCTSLTSVALPNTVTSIGTHGFEHCDNLASVTLSNNLTTIGSSAFDFCPKLMSISIPASVTSIDQLAFNNVEDVTIDAQAIVGATYGGYAQTLCKIFGNMKTLVLGSHITSVGKNAFASCKNLVSLTVLGDVTTIGEASFSLCEKLSSVDMGNAVTTLEKDAFNYCHALEYVPLPSTLETIGESAFINCTSLTSVVIPNSVTIIGPRAFSRCSNLESATLSDNLISIGNYAFSDCAIKFISIPEGVTSIGSNAFNTVEYLVIDAYTIIESENYSGNGFASDVFVKVKNITFGSHVTSIGRCAFTGCKELTSITFPNTLTNISNSAFLGCSKLVSADIPSSVKYLGDDAFNACRSLLSVTISADTIGHYAYRDCTSLTSVIFTESVTTIRDWSFYNCSNLVEVELPNTITSMGAYTFRGCSKLKSVHIPASVQSMADGTFYETEDITIDAQAIVGHNGYSGSAITHFSNVKKCTIGGGITRIGDWAFHDCAYLTTVVFPEELTTIGGHAFVGCRVLTDITIPSHVTNIGESAFENCSAMTSITIDATTPPACGTKCFQDVPKNIPVYVPCRSLSEYQTADEWRDFTNIQGVNCPYTRPTTPGNYGTICLPRAVAPEDIEGGKFYNIIFAVKNTSQEIAGVLMEEEIGGLEAGKPYIFRAANDELVLPYTGDAVTEPIVANGLVGNFSATPLNVPQNMYVLSNNQLRKLDGGTASVGQNRAYIDLTSVIKLNFVPAGAPNRTIINVQGTNPIATGLADDNAALSPVKVMRNGRMVILREHKTYDMLGNIL